MGSGQATQRATRLCSSARGTACSDPTQRWPSAPLACTAQGRQRQRRRWRPECELARRGHSARVARPPRRRSSWPRRRRRPRIPRARASCAARRGAADRGGSRTVGTGGEGGMDRRRTPLPSRFQPRGAAWCAWAAGAAHSTRAQHSTPPQHHRGTPPRHTAAAQRTAARPVRTARDRPGGGSQSGRTKAASRGPCLAAPRR